MKIPVVSSAIGFVFLIVVGVLILNLGGGYHNRVVERCVSLQLGMMEQEIVTRLGHRPVSRVRFRQGEVNIETLFFEPVFVLSRIASQDIYTDIDLTTKRAIKIVCDEDFSLVDPVIEEMNKKGVYKERVNNP